MLCSWAHRPSADWAHHQTVAYHLLLVSLSVCLDGDFCSYHLSTGGQLLIQHWETLLMCVAVVATTIVLVKRLCKEARPRADAERQSQHHSVTTTRWLDRTRNRVGLAQRQDVHGNFHDYQTRYDEDEKGRLRRWAESRILQ